ncbi:DUF5666 domain-containing protein [Pengzhenrongella sicca]|uniref:DUF5666 domain-containing protein n=1 Tax=Pengzhenrongella sicca TaxID=2819238 RepID=A0A8A4ZCR4_9MICO|nr:DUF5666 domain-containing protein [Pengzhenrongella sicca]QTE29722.1 hypothetical protein J4E96_01315 [Pengzhenrongella sicca]
MSRLSPTRTRSRLVLSASAVVLLLALTGCSGDSSASTSDATPSEAASADDGAQAGGREAGGEMPGGGGVTGTIAAITGAVLQVQGSDSQTAVTYSADTAITQTLAAALAQVSVGSCVVAISASADDAADDAAVAAAATSIAISAPVDGECAAGAGFGGGMASGEMPSGEMPTDMPTDMPADMPTDMPTDMPSGMGGFGQFTTGLVTAVDASTITVQVTAQDDTTSSATVTVDAATAYTTTAAADASAIAVGLCAVAQGESDDSGQLTATSLVLSTAGDDGCSTGFGGMGGARSGSAPSND